nr:MAG TPA: hypothetical protein [Caudoviricetes sp.]
MRETQKSFTDYFRAKNKTIDVLLSSLVKYRQLSLMGLDKILIYLRTMTVK